MALTGYKHPLFISPDGDRPAGEVFALFAEAQGRAVLPRASHEPYRLAGDGRAYWVSLYGDGAGGYRFGVYADDGRHE